MPIGEFSERSGLSPKRLRTSQLVDSLSQWRFIRHLATGQLREAQLIDALREAGMPLADIGACLRGPSGAQLDAWARRVETNAAQHHQALDLARQLLSIEVSPFVAVDAAPFRSAKTLELRTVSRTEIGRVRDNNEDAVMSSSYLVAVADGMGGHPGGEIASAVAISLIQAAFTGQSLDELQSAVRAANRAIWDRSSANAELEGMGTTICAAGLVEDGKLAVVNVGDSRSYMLRNGSLTQMSQDHSVTAEAVRRGELSEQEALNHPHRSVLTRALGVAPDVVLYSAIQPIVEGDRLLLCTDGLFNEVPDDEIASMMAETEDLQATADGLVELALSRGGRDNVSVGLAELHT
jgi:PPM family protein phosphatase